MISAAAPLFMVVPAEGLCAKARSANAVQLSFALSIIPRMFGSTPVHVPALALRFTVGGQVIVGSSMSATITSKVHVRVLLYWSAAV